jgi:uncharacterized membrane protein YsdA (DUF1294 family)
MHILIPLAFIVGTCFVVSCVLAFLIGVTGYLADRKFGRRQSLRVSEHALC